MGLYEPAPGLLRQAEDDAEGLRQTLSPDQGKAYGLYGPPGGKLTDLPLLLLLSCIVAPAHPAVDGEPVEGDDVRLP